MCDVLTPDLLLDVRPGRERATRDGPALNASELACKPMGQGNATIHAHIELVHVIVEGVTTNYHGQQLLLLFVAVNPIH